MKPSIDHVRADHRMRLALLVCIVQFCWSVDEDAAKADFTCDAGNFTLGQRGSVTCHFGPKVYSAHFEIVMYPFQAPASHIGNDVLRCHWLSEIKSVCNAERGYYFDNKLQDNVTVFIPNITKDFAGRYSCQLIPTGNRKKRLCYLYVTGAERTPPPPPPLPPPNVSHASSDSRTAWILVGVFAALFGVCLIVVFFVINRKPRKAHRYRGVSVKRTSARFRKRKKNEKLAGEAEDAKRQPLNITITPFDECKDAGPSHVEPPNISAWPKPPLRGRYPMTPYSVAAEEGKQSTVDSEPKTFTMPLIQRLDQMASEDIIEQAVPPGTKMPHSGLRRPVPTT